MRRAIAVAVAVLAVVVPAGAAFADGVDGGADGALTQVRGADGNIYTCLEQDADQGCRTDVTRFDDETGSLYELWIAPSGRVYWLPSETGGKYRYTPPPEGTPDAGPLVQPLPEPPPAEPIVYDPYGMNGDPSGCGGE